MLGGGKVGVEVAWGVAGLVGESGGWVAVGVSIMTEVEVAG